MNFILNHKYSYGNTPIRPEEAEQLILRISTMRELNESEALNFCGKTRSQNGSVKSVVEEAQPADLKYVVLFKSTLWETGALKFPNRA